MLKKLEKDAVIKANANHTSSFAEWYENEYISNCSIITKKELFYTSWWQIKSSPDLFYIHKFDNKAQATAIRDANSDIPINLLSDTLTTFEANLKWIIDRDGESIEVRPHETYICNLNDILLGYDGSTFPTQRDRENAYKRLMQTVVNNLFRRNRLRKFELSNKKYAYYQPNNKDLKLIKFIYPFSNKSKRKSIVGSYKKYTAFWHYAISVQVCIEPILGFYLKPHIIFTEDGFTPISDDKKMHRFRRDKGKLMFNENWRDLFLAFIQRLKDNNEDIKIIVDYQNNNLVMKQWPELFWSEKDYLDPNLPMDISKIEDYVESFDEDDL